MSRKYLEVFNNAFGGDALWNNHNIELDEVSQ